jgi:hypothetical protein
MLDPGGIPISANATTGSVPAIATDGTDSLVVWTDLRNGVSAAYGLRIARNGTILDRGAFVISSTTASGYLSSPAVAFDGRGFGNYLVVWSDTRSGVQGALVNPQGTVVTSAYQIASGDSPAIASDGTNYFVVSSAYDYPRPNRISGTRVDRNGRVLDPAGIPISSSGASTPEPSVGFNGTTYLVVWAAAKDWRSVIYGARVSPGGTVLDAEPIQIASGISDPNFLRTVSSPTVASDGVNFLVAWTDARFGCCSIFGSRVGPDGSVLDPAGIAIATRGREQLEPAVAYDGANYFFVAWTDNRSSTGPDVYGARVNRAGRVLDPRGILVSAAPRPKKRCVVPRVTGMPLERAKRSIHSARCSIAGVRTRRGSRRAGRVVAQSPRPGAVRPRGYPVSIVVGRS